MPRPLAYHITWGTYGKRLHGDARPTVDRDHNEFGTPPLPRDDERNARERELLKFAPVELTVEQRLFIESIVSSVCERGHWTFLTCAAGPDHVHVVLSSHFDPETIRRLLKRWIGQALSEHWPLEPGSTWWAEDGSTKWAFDEGYRENMMKYVHRQRTAK